MGRIKNIKLHIVTDIKKGFQFHQFLSKLNEYREKATGLGFGELVESNSAIEELRAFEMGNLTKKYGAINMEEFPTFSWEEPITETKEERKKKHWKKQKKFTPRRI